MVGFFLHLAAVAFDSLVKIGDGGALLIIDPDLVGGCTGVLEGVSHHQRDELAGVIDLVVLERQAHLVDLVFLRHAAGRVVQLREVVVMKDVDHAGRLFCHAGIDVGDFAAGDGAEHAVGIHHAGQVVVRGILGAAGQLLRAVDAWLGSTDDFLAHGCSPVLAGFIRR